MTPGLKASKGGGGDLATCQKSGRRDRKYSASFGSLGKSKEDE